MTTVHGVGVAPAQPGPPLDRTRVLTVALLLVVAATHLLLVPDHLEEAPYAGWLFLALGVTCLGLAVVVVVTDQPLALGLAGLVCLAALAAYVVSRTVGLPQLGDDVGNWTEPLALPAVLAEALLVVLATPWPRQTAAARP